VVRSESLFFDRQRAPVKRFGSIAFSAGAVQGGQIVQIYSDFVVLRTIYSFEGGQRAKVELLGFFVFPLAVQESRERGGIRGYIGMIRPQRLLPNLYGPAGEWFASRIAATA
jgi:hypothetical protein